MTTTTKKSERVSWTNEEVFGLAKIMVSYMLASPGVTKTSALNHAQEHYLPENRRRTISSLTFVPLLDSEVIRLWAEKVAHIPKEETAINKTSMVVSSQKPKTDGSTGDEIEDQVCDDCENVMLACLEVPTPVRFRTLKEFGSTVLYAAAKEREQEEKMKWDLYMQEAMVKMAKGAIVPEFAPEPTLPIQIGYVPPPIVKIGLLGWTSDQFDRIVSHAVESGVEASFVWLNCEASKRASLGNVNYIICSKFIRHAKYDQIVSERAKSRVAYISSGGTGKAVQVARDFASRQVNLLT